MRRAARMPRGVAALPRPSRLADTLADTAARVSGSRLARGRSRRRAGRSSAASFPERPQRDMISMTPLHRHSTPAMAMHSCTAAPAPSRAAAPTASMVPFHAAKISDTAAIPVQIQAIAICIPPPAHVYDRENT